MALRFYSRRLGRVLTEAEAIAAGLPQRHGVYCGLGSAVERLAKPIARWIDARHADDAVLDWLVRAAVVQGWVTLPLAGCAACSARRAWLDWLVPDVRSWAAWRGAVGRLQAGRKARS
jgi:hypothetical protein